MKITNINEFKKFLETYSAEDTLNVFAGVLGEPIIQQIQQNYQTEFNAVTEQDKTMYAMTLKQSNGLIIDRIVYCPTGEWNKFEWWSASSTSEESLSFPTWNAVAEWCNKRHNINLPLLQN